MTDFCQSITYIQFSCDMQLSDFTPRKVISNVSVFTWNTDKYKGFHSLRNYKGEEVVCVTTSGIGSIDLRKLPFSDMNRVYYFLFNAGIKLTPRSL